MARVTLSVLIKVRIVMGKKKKVKKEEIRKRKVDLGRKKNKKGKAETPLSLQKALFWPPPLR